MFGLSVPDSLFPDVLLESYRVPGFAGVLVHDSGVRVCFLGFWRGS